MDSSHLSPLRALHQRSSTANSSFDATPSAQKSARFSTYGEDSSSDSYLSQLLTYSVERLNKEPELLKQEAEKIDRQIMEVSVDHYEAYLSAEKCLKDLHVMFESLNESLTGFQNRLPSFDNACLEFEKGSKASQQKWKEKRKLLNNRDAVLTVLEVPKLMETCVRNGNIDEALDLQSFVHRLSIHCNDLSIVKAIRQASLHVKDLILKQLTEKLKTSIQLPECLNTVGHIRRLGVYSERELRAFFLLCKEHWISSVISETEEDQSFEYLKRLTDIHRLHLFDVVIQYKAVFASDRNDSEEGMLANWTLHRIENYLEALREKLPTIKDGASLFSLLESCMYCGMSLGRVGLDFRHLLIAVFEPCVLGLFKTRLDGALDAFSVQLESYRWTSLSQPTESTNAAESNGATRVKDLTLPVQLGQHLPVAVFVNGYLSGLNELRHCAPLSGRKKVRKWMHDALNEFVTKLSEVRFNRLLDSTQKDVLETACREIRMYLGPYIVATLDSIYADTDESRGVSSNQTVVLPLERLDAAPPAQQTGS
eukprot:g5809.t1